MLKAVGRWYRGRVHKELAKYGLRYEDVIIKENPDVEQALKYLPREEMIARQRRIKRAVDLSFKHEELPAEIQKLQEPGKIYLEPLMKEFRKLREEREILNPPY